ncbi:Uncharacterized protein TCM_015990 [Theobroma cacao]|uniref:Uncharacterized protein n=1 Tax=Theobroma cacao TaxID=3641 RepID=A0A061G4P5_THECC|nr:Uncharacterized protein TCM_015990 [Theobroma cacao]
MQNQIITLFVFFCFSHQHIHILMLPPSTIRTRGMILSRISDEKDLRNLKSFSSYCAPYMNAAVTITSSQNFCFFFFSSLKENQDFLMGLSCGLPRYLWDLLLANYDYNLSYW